MRSLGISSGESINHRELPFELKVTDNPQIFLGGHLQLAENVLYDENRNCMIARNNNGPLEVVPPVNAVAPLLPLERAADMPHKLLKLVVMNRRYFHLTAC
jgi:hypothetical protein